MRPPRNDLLVALVVAALAALEVRFNGGVHPKWAGLVTELPFSLALAWRRRYPIAVVVALALGWGLEPALGVPPDQPVVPVLALVIALYSLAANAPVRRAFAGFALMLPAAAVSALHIHGDAAVKLGNAAFGLVIAGGAWTAGAVVRSRTQQAGALARRAERLESERAVAVAAERARIARELHDVLAHSISVMVVQAGAAAEVMRAAPDRAAEALDAVQETGRQALVEMGRLVGLLRERPEELGYAPQRRLADLDELADRMRDAGLPVDLRIEGEKRPVPLGVDLSAYRVVQEALTNALKHGGGATAVVRVAYRPGELALEILDDGGGTGNGGGSGHGLIGMRERIAVFGGEFDAGPRPEGGFAVRACLPLGSS
ncbi:MAG TPA: histidine kinase [Gaiellaceae bacterium]|nr:histidine kinase [Gaiellaceae bacterium]